MKCLLRPCPTDRPLLPLTPEGFAAWRDSASEATRKWCEQSGFEGQAGRVLSIPAEDGGIERVLFGLGDTPDLWTWASLPDALPKGAYAIEGDSEHGEEAALAFALASYRFDRYTDNPAPEAELSWPEGVDQERVTRLAKGQWLARDLINTPAEDMGPEELTNTLKGLADEHGAKFNEIVGDDLLKENYPAVHAVGRAASRPPRLGDLVWGDESHPKVTLVGKGVIFDSGGLDLKPAEGMRLMKKDMGGAATVLGLASAIMDAKLPVRLRVLIPAVENAVAGNAFRPGDILNTRKGLTVEIGNTDAEGRLILCDALAEADTEDPAMIIDFATLTGAARVALGTELPALFCNDDALAGDLLQGGIDAQDQLWRMPLWDDYRRHMLSPIADLNNISKARFGGAITAALYLREFVRPETPWAHIDTMAWNEEARPGRPRGGEGFALRGIYAALESKFA